MHLLNKRKQIQRKEKALTTFEATNSVFNITDKNTNLSIATSSRWIPKGGGETSNKLNTVVLRTQFADIKNKELSQQY